MRIIAGSHRGRKLVAPEGEVVRPTSDRAREALFGILGHGEPELVGCRFLDVFAGTGAVALEALSRGAAEATLIEQDRVAVAAIRRNIDLTKEGERARLVVADATRLRGASHRFDIAFVDPPYGSGLAASALGGLHRRDWLEPAARVVVEMAAADPFEAPEGFTVEEERRYGAGRFIFLRYGETAEAD